MVCSLVFTKLVLDFGYSCLCFVFTVLGYVLVFAGCLVLCLLF